MADVPALYCRFKCEHIAYIWLIQNRFRFFKVILMGINRAYIENDKINAQLIRRRKKNSRIFCMPLKFYTHRCTAVSIVKLIR